MICPRDKVFEVSADREPTREADSHVFEEFNTVDR